MANHEERSRGPERIDADTNGPATLFARWTWTHAYSVSYELWRAIAWEPDGSPLFAIDSEKDPFKAKPLAEAPPFLHGFIKWDSCNQWWWPEAMHEDDQAGFEALIAGLNRTRQIAIDILGDKWNGY